MFSGYTLLRKEIISQLKRIDIKNNKILEIGGNIKNKTLFKNAEYYSLGYEADINIDLNTDFTNKFDVQFDYIIISCTMMYMNNVNNFLFNCISYMTKNSKIILMESYLYPQTNHKNIFDNNRVSFDYINNFFKNNNLTILHSKKVGGIFSIISMTTMDLLPSFAKRLIGGLVIEVGRILDMVTIKIDYFSKRHDKYYQGYIIEAQK